MEAENNKKTNPKADKGLTSVLTDAIRTDSDAKDPISEDPSLADCYQAVLLDRLKSRLI